MGRKLNKNDVKLLRDSILRTISRLGWGLIAWTLLCVNEKAGDCRVGYSTYNVSSISEFVLNFSKVSSPYTGCALRISTNTVVIVYTTMIRHGRCSLHFRHVQKFSQ